MPPTRMPRPPRKRSRRAHLPPAHEPAGLLGLLGLGQRAGKVVVGTDAIRGALGRGRVRLVVAACDRGERTESKVMRLARARGVPVVTGPEARVLGRCVGRNVVHAIGICDQGLAEGIRARLDSDGL